MSQVTNGTVAFSRVKKDDEFGINRKADISLSFTVDAGDDFRATARDVGFAVLELGEELLSGKKPAAAPASTTNDKDKLAAPIIAPPAAPRRGRPPAAPKSATAVKQDVDPADIGVATPSTQAPLSVNSVADPTDPASIAEEDWGGTLPEVTDVDLTSACSRVSKAVGGAGPVKTVIAKFVGQKTLKEIPQELRNAFLAEIEALIPAKA